MKVVLLKDIPGVGRRNEVKNVSDGYALNSLIPKKLAIAGTPATIAHAERQRSEEEAERKVQEDLLFKNFSSAQGVVIELSGKANEKGNLFASIHTEAVVEALKKQKGIDMLPEFLQLDKPIKEVGEHKIPVKVQGKTGSFTLIVKSG
ncbi:MAG: 50S ribosomal protein L9 [Candidatus Taylorbacteria bacterium]|nr:50S ribosomal protein L9 [Candidatus Taylorbacteria bacterium]